MVCICTLTAYTFVTTQTIILHRQTTLVLEGVQEQQRTGTLVIIIALTIKVPNNSRKHLQQKLYLLDWWVQHRDQSYWTSSTETQADLEKNQERKSLEG